jgi:hypothetical protein
MGCPEFVQNQWSELLSVVRRPDKTAASTTMPKGKYTSGKFLAMTYHT